MEYVFIFVLGLVIGSFVNVLIYRIPKGKSIVFPSSYCPNCKNPLKWYHNIPLLSYILLKGKCTFCKKTISLQYPLVEILTAILMLITYQKFSLFSLKVFFWAFSFVFFLIAISFIDLKEKIIPDSLSLSLIFLGWLFSLFKFNPFFSFEYVVISSLAGIGLLFLINEVYYLVAKREGMGMGDFKLMGGIGAYLGYKSFYFVILIASITAVFTICVYLLFLKLSKKEMPRNLMKLEIPFGPYLCLGALVYLFFRIG